MCGRYANSKSGADMAALFDADDLIAGAWTPSYNIAPTVQAPVVRRSGSRESRVVELARWGLVPPWASDPSVGTRMFNARIETVATSRAYKRPFASRRALIPADGWYEWRKLPGGGKQPYFFTQPGGVVFAGLWDTWSQGDVSMLSFTVLTCPALNEAVETVHDRMPYVLPPERFGAWLGEEDADEGELLAGPETALEDRLEIRKVGRAVGRTGNDGPELVRPIAEQMPGSQASPGGDSGSSTIPGL
ncbi:SOS response-associated peptidase [Glycomyces buryatensis]|uniref:Abasic site processing protein n=1 Tax=Glycomyces buryatensis TaxID=2570927 RepID=A0A4S8QHQ3_9ACTN|nr:SOS response-associated peptidase [Glycomyces buryatensis]THV43271.1 SOS response-associated peptidase [Glycomyces buryatensis]